MLLGCGKGFDDYGVGEASCGKVDSSKDLIVNSATTTVHPTETTNVHVNVSAANVVIQDNSKIGNLSINGSNNLITINSGTEIGFICIQGSDNNIAVPAGSGIQINKDSGVGNSLIEN